MLAYHHALPSYKGDSAERPRRVLPPLIIRRLTQRHNLTRETAIIIAAAAGFALEDGR
jgi:hypothetical protein